VDCEESGKLSTQEDSLAGITIFEYLIVLNEVIALSLLPSKKPSLCLNNETKVSSSSPRGDSIIQVNVTLISKYRYGLSFFAVYSNYKLIYGYLILPESTESCRTGALSPFA
jgi:hypothetical protein